MKTNSSELLVRVLLICLGAWASSATAGTVGFSWDNDLLTGTDRGYTNGVRMTYLTAPVDDHSADPGRKQALAFSLSQLMVTPENIEARQPQFNDIPYTGYLSARAELWRWDADEITGYGGLIGVVGPESRAEETQRQVHRLTGSTNPRGWDNQLGTDVILGLGATHARRFYSSGTPSVFEQDMGWMGGLRASNFLSDVHFGVSWRAGTNLPANFIPDYAGIASSVGLPGSLDVPGSGWSVFAGAMAQWIPYSYIDEQAPGYRYNQKRLVGHAGFGVGWHTPGFQVTLSVRTTSSQTTTNKRPLSFGTIAVNWRL